MTEYENASKRPLEPDRAYCPECRTERWGYRIKDDGTCKECAEIVQGRWPITAYAKHLALLTIGVGIFGAIFLGPIIYIAWAWMHGTPLWGYETIVVEKTVSKPTGALTKVWPVFFLWFFIWFFMWAAAGGMPRP